MCIRDSTYTELTGDVRFEDVTFGYNPDKVILKDISLFAKPGQKLAFVGSDVYKRQAPRSHGHNRTYP